MSDFEWNGLQAVIDRQVVSGPNADYLAGIYKATLMLNEYAECDDPDDPIGVRSIQRLILAIRESIQDGTL